MIDAARGARAQCGHGGVPGGVRLRAAAVAGGDGGGGGAAHHGGGGPAVAGLDAAGAAGGASGTADSTGARAGATSGAAARACNPPAPWPGSGCRRHRRGAPSSRGRWRHSAAGHRPPETALAGRSRFRGFPSSRCTPRSRAAATKPSASSTPCLLATVASMSLPTVDQGE